MTAFLFILINDQAESAERREPKRKNSRSSHVQRALEAAALGGDFFL
jgi:hypothetical protein